MRDHFYQCAAGVSVASIRVDGAISGCTSIRANFNQGNIYRDKFWDVWQNRFEPFRNREWARCGECASCKMFRYCLGGGMHLHGDDGGCSIATITGFDAYPFLKKGPPSVGGCFFSRLSLSLSALTSAVPISVVPISTAHPRMPFPCRLFLGARQFFPCRLRS